MITNNVTSPGTSALSDLISKVMDRFDTDKDKKLSQAEFSSFLTGLLQGQVATPAATTTPVPKVPDPAVKVGDYRNRLAGFDFRKMDDTSISDANTSKYKAARIFQDYPPMPESLPAVIERLKAIGVNASHDGKDKIDFGDGYGQIDVIQGAYPGGGVAWQWIPQGEIHT